MLLNPGNSIFIALVSELDKQTDKNPWLPLQPSGKQLICLQTILKKNLIDVCSDKRMFNEMDTMVWPDKQIGKFISVESIKLLVLPFIARMFGNILFI